MTVGKNDFNSNKQYKQLIPQTIKVIAFLWTRTSLSSLCVGSFKQDHLEQVIYRTPDIYYIILKNKHLVTIKTLQLVNCNNLYHL